jgi:cytochrome c-type biogenesis protein CcmF
MEYIGELLLPRKIGHLAVVLSFVAALLATISYFFSTQNEKIATPTEGGGYAWKNIGRWAFGIHGVSVFAIIGSIFYVMLTKRYEYFYAHSHVNDNLENKYVFSAFWEGQEGSFLLWMFWHVGLGLFLMFKNRHSIWESPVLAVLASVQVFLSSMILGLHFGWGENIIKWGSNPTLLLREVNDAPIFSQPDYLEKIRGSAKGLNALLQNYWMTIHPPTLFLGFASTVVPFCYAVAGLWTKRYTEWLKPALPYALFSAAILGTGIMMGGMWAYEALSFNGYWAWDPVENTSLVPWIVLVAGIHTHLIAKSTGHSLRATVLFYFLTFLLILYSTFLTRSGILGDTSAHAFTEMGLEWQLVFFQAAYIGLSLYLLFKHFKNIPNPQKEEAVSSREFWMFIGSLVLLLSVVLISFTTSIPVFNKILSYAADFFKMNTPPRFTAPVDTLAHYNKTQLWIGVFMGFLSAIAQFLRYKEFNFEGYRKTLTKHLTISGLLTGLLMIPALYWIEARAWQYILLLFAGIFTVASNIEYAMTFYKKNPKASGSAVAHFGMGILIVGILASGLNKKWISSNPFAMRGMTDFTEEQMGKYILLFKNAPMYMNGYLVTYLHDTAYDVRRDFTVIYKKLGEDSKTVIDSFTLHPHVLFDKNTGKIAANNPDTRHFWNYDIFTNIASLPPGEQDPEIARQQEDSLKYRDFEVNLNTPFSPDLTGNNTPQFRMTIDGLDMNPTHPKYKAEEKDIAIGVDMTFISNNDSVFKVKPIVLLRGENVYQLPSTINALRLRVKADMKLFDNLFMPEKELVFKEYNIQENAPIKIGNKTITLESINPQAKPDNFTLKEGDLSLGLKLRVTTEGGQNHFAEPVYVIRGNQPIPLRARIDALGMHLAIAKVNPETKTFTLSIAERDPKSVKIPISIAENAPETDYMVLEATVNPGINLVWTGCIMMMIGLAMAMFYRIKQVL